MSALMAGDLTLSRDMVCAACLLLIRGREPFSAESITAAASAVHFSHSCEDCEMLIACTARHYHSNAVCPQESEELIKSCNAKAFGMDHQQTRETAKL